MNISESKNNIAKKTFREKGTCSQTFAYLLNNEFGNSLEDEERATDPLAGGIMRKGHQCGMLWGSALALGAKSFHKTKDVHKASALAIMATKNMMESFIEKITGGSQGQHIKLIGMDELVPVSRQYSLKIKEQTST